MIPLSAEFPCCLATLAATIPTLRGSKCSAIGVDSHVHPLDILNPGAGSSPRRRFRPREDCHKLLKHNGFRISSPSFRTQVIGITLPVPEEIDDPELERRLFAPAGFHQGATPPQRIGRSCMRNSSGAA